MNMHLSWAKAYKIMLVPRSQKAAHMTELSLRSTLNLCISRDNSGRVYRPRRDDWTSLFPPNECATVDVSQMQRPMIIVVEERATLKDSRGTRDRHPFAR
jgi:hypothetical protein